MHAMANLLYLVHRLPYPPNKGDKVRSYHLLKHLASKHRVFLGTFIDDPDDAVHIDKLRSMCAALHVAPLHPVRARIGSLAGLLGGEALTLRYYRNAGLRRWVRQTVQHERIDASVVFSSSMAQYAEGLKLPMLVDFVDVDSAKWTQYAGNHRWPMSWLYRREGTRLLAYERAVAQRSARAFFVTEKELALFRSLAPECTPMLESVSNGVDADYFAPDPARASPFAPGEVPVVFTGAMDYWPNIDAVTWFAQDMLPRLRERWPALRFHIVGRSPTVAVRALANEAVCVSGTVPDVRPYLQHAAVVVAPLRLARGVQNKILEAMAMGRPVVASQACGDAIAAHAGAEILAGVDADGFIRQIGILLCDPAHAAAIGRAGRQRVLRDHGWSVQLSALDRHLENSTAHLAEAVPA
jgi:sugar transferase (PEP-CTERM/EpsH1 system associated)